jgi:hypothetical protein
VRRAALGACAAVLLAGCGSSGPHLPKDVYVRRADTICRRYQAAIAKLGQPTKISEIGPFIGKALPVLSRTVDQLGKLAPPEGLDSQFADFIAAARATVSRAQALRDAAAKADGASVQRLLKEAAKASARRTSLAHAADLDACALS